MSLAKYMGGIFMVIVGIFMIPLSFIAPLSFLFPIAGAEPNPTSFFIIFIATLIIAVVIIITGSYYIIKGKAEVVRGTTSRHDIKIDKKEGHEPERKEPVKEKVIKVIICPKCKHENSEKAKFCEKCGKKIL